MAGPLQPVDIYPTLSHWKQLNLFPFKKPMRHQTDQDLLCYDERDSVLVGADKSGPATPPTTVALDSYFRFTEIDIQLNQLVAKFCVVHHAGTFTRNTDVPCGIVMRILPSTDFLTTPVIKAVSFTEGTSKKNPSILVICIFTYTPSADFLQVNLHRDNLHDCFK